MNNFYPAEKVLVSAGRRLQSANYPARGVFKKNPIDFNWMDRIVVLQAGGRRGNLLR